MKRQVLILPALEKLLASVPDVVVKPDMWLHDRGWTLWSDRLWRHATRGKGRTQREAVDAQLDKERLMLRKVMAWRRRK